MAETTPEQEAVIHHPPGHHARVLAVAGAGKTTTMVRRVRELVLGRGIAPGAIAILMFNRLAKEDFEAKLEAIGLAPRQRPRVHTFHSFAYGFIRAMIDRGAIPQSTVLWTGEREELVRLTVHRAIDALAARGAIAAGGAPGRGQVDPEEAGNAIGLWKGSLIPPERAGSRGHPDLPLVYREFEALRTRAGALTFDDFVPAAVRLLEEDAAIARTWAGRKDHLIVDEYQDVNYGQQRLIELLAADRADVMVVGDDDQTIYEWRGARPNYLIREFEGAFANKPHREYQLTRSFRFGPTIAQCAHNVIGFNAARVPKPLVAHDPAREARIEILAGAEVDRQLAEQVEALLGEPGTGPRDIIVLARMFVQLSGLEAEFLARRIPYQVRGSQPFFARRELRVLLDYLRFALTLERPLTREAEDQLLAIANTPSRKLRRDVLRTAMRAGRIGGLSAIAALTTLVDGPGSTLGKWQAGQINELLDNLERLRARLDGEPRLGAGELLDWLVETVGYLAHFDDYYGHGESAVERKFAVRRFVDYARATGLPARDFLTHIDRLDPTQGEPPERQLTLTTIFRTKGLEYDYVVLPQCDEGYVPCLYSAGDGVFDTAGRVREPAASAAVENERRLFYVGVTRARKCVFIGTSAGGRPPVGSPDAALPGGRASRFLEEIQLESVRGIMEPYQRLARGEAGAWPRLLDSLAARAGVRWVRQHFVGRYLDGMIEGNQPFADRIAQTLAHAQETPFAYRHSYPDNQGNMAARAKEALTPPRSR